MRERNAQIVLLVRSFEEADPEGTVLSMQARAAATRRALRVTGLADWDGDLFAARNVRTGETAARRARLLLQSLAGKIPSLRGLLETVRLGMGTTAPIAVAALLSGLLSNVLGPERRVNLLSFPLLGVLAWNLTMYLLVLVRPIVRRLAERRSGAPGTSGLVSGLAGWVMTGPPWRLIQEWKLSHGREGSAGPVVAQAMARFGTSWHRCASRLLAARVRRSLHVAAIALALGTLAGMYLRGIAFEYQATWESTWLNVRQVQVALETLLGPAATLLGVEVPDVAPLRGPEGSGPAGPWIHLYAVTVLLVVVLPRTALALFEGLRARWLAAALPVDLTDDYFRGVFRDWRGSATVVDILPYSFEPDMASLDVLKDLLRDLFGARADLRVRQPLAYGDDPALLRTTLASNGPRRPADADGPEPEPPDGNQETCYVVLFNAAQPPEAEVHGDFLERVKTRLGEHENLLVLIDLAPYARRVDAPGRSEERLRAWERIARQAGLEAVGLDAGVEVEPLAAALGRALWPQVARGTQVAKASR